MTRSRPLPPIAVTMGEPSGIGGEIALKAWARGPTRVPPFFVLDDPARLDALARRIGIAAPVQAIDAPGEALGTFRSALPVLPVALAAEAIPGRPDPANVPAVIAAIDQAVGFARNGSVAAVVTNPVHKSTLYKAGFPHPGHTEYLASLDDSSTPPVMMLAGASLRVVPVTIHLSLKEAIRSLSTECIVQCGRIAAAALTTDFGIARPRLSVAGLNPHAGEDGLMGREEIEVILPAIETLRAEGILAEGPFPSDTLFHETARTTYDAALCMYHDQALIPLKTIDFDGGVNITLGLQFVRTSPDHGTAFSIAGTGTARETSLVAALSMAHEMARHRRESAANSVIG